MAYDEKLAERIGALLDGRDGVTSRRMFGGLCFMAHGHMCCGITGGELMLRGDPAWVADALTQPHTRPMDFTGRVMKNMLYVGPGGFATDEQLAEWVDTAYAYAASLPPKKK
jgi:TfoX/Sxy family transcriptional regulator of competence genes